MSGSRWLRALSTGWLLVLLAACTRQSTPQEVRAPPPPPPPPPPALPEPPAKRAGRVVGIDVSHYQQTVNWERVGSTVSFVFIKATDFTGVDPRFTSHWEGARKAAIPRGAYHFFHPKHGVEVQVANFVRHLKSDPGELPPVVDVEQFQDEYQGLSCEQLADMLRRFSQGVEKELGRKPMIYTNAQTWKRSFCAHPYFLDHPLWLAQYKQQVAEPGLPTGWSRWLFWQYTDKGVVAGVSGQVDQSYFNGTLEELKALLQAR